MPIPAEMPYITNTTISSSLESKYLEERANISVLWKKPPIPAIMRVAKAQQKKPIAY